MHGANDARQNLRVPILLLWLLLLTTLGVAGLTWYALRGQRAELEQSQHDSRQQALVLLSTQIEHKLLRAMQDPLLLLRNIPHVGVTDERLGAIIRRYPYVDNVVVLNQQLQPVHSNPPLLDKYQQRLIGWISQRLEEAREAGTGSGPRYFVETVEEGPALFAFEPLTDPSVDAPGANASSAGWVMVRIDVEKLRDSILQPAIASFSSKQAAVMRLYKPEEQMSDKGQSVDLSPVLPGWRIAIVSASPNSSTLHKPWLPIFGIATGIVLSVALITAVIAWDLRREYALVELRNRFVANVSHELRTPLSLIRMYAETLCMRRVPDPQRQHQYHITILKEAEHLSRMIDDVLDFARLREGLPRYQLTETDLRRTVQNVVEQYSEKWRSRGVDVKPILDEHVSPVAHDPHGVRQILLNLIDNAIKYGGEGEAVWVRLFDERDRVVLEVCDAGPGIDNRERRRLQMSMRRGRMAESAKGYGLGLALVEQIAKVHGARVTLDGDTELGGMAARTSFPAEKVAV
ncbi:MAG: HAMP domain-containing sensor histidine kinase [Gammaproteobacteria bacterium]